MIDRKLAIGIAAAVITLAVIITASYLFDSPAPDDAPEVPIEIDIGLETPADPGQAILYYPGSRDRLYVERRALSAELEGEAKISLVVSELLLGPESDDLVSALPAEVTVGGVSLDGNGTLFLDLSFKGGLLRGMGSTAEMLAVYSLVNTVVANAPEVRAVVLLWNGRQYPSLAGHVDTTRPLTANSRLVAERS